MNKILIVAELSANHNGRKEIAIETIKAAKRAGANAIKLQTYTADTITIDCHSSDFYISTGIWSGKYLYDLYQEAYTPWEWHAELFETAHKEGLVCFSSPFDKTAIDFLESLNNPIYKIASFEITDIPLIEYAAKKMKPMVISAGIAAIEDIQLAIGVCRNVGNNDITLLKCTSSYPAPIEDANLIMIKDMADRFNVKVGLSDHTIGSSAAIASVAMGVSLIEKHFIIDRNIGGPDASFSMNEVEFTAMVTAVREAEMAIGIVDYSVTDKMLKSRESCRSLYVVEDIKAGEVITEENVRSIRPGYGMHPKYFKEVLGQFARFDLPKGTPLKSEMLAKHCDL